MGARRAAGVAVVAAVIAVVAVACVVPPVVPPPTSTTSTSSTSTSSAPPTIPSTTAPTLPPEPIGSAWGVYEMPQTNVVPAGQGGRTWVLAPASAAGEQIRLVWGCGYVTLVDTTVELVDLGDGTAGASIAIPAEIADGGYLYCSLWEFASPSLPAPEARAFIQWSNPRTWMVSVTHGVAGPPTDSIALRTNTPTGGFQIQKGAPSSFVDRLSISVAHPAAAGQQVRVIVDCPVSGGVIVDAAATFPTAAPFTVSVPLPAGFASIWNAAIPGDPAGLPDRLCRVTEITPSSIPAPNGWSLVSDASPYPGGSSGTGLGIFITHPAA